MFEQFEGLMHFAADFGEGGARFIDEAEARTAKLVADAEERLSQIRIEKEAVAGYFESLRNVLQQAEKVTAEKVTPEKVTPEKVSAEKVIRTAA